MSLPEETIAKLKENSHKRQFLLAQIDDAAIDETLKRLNNEKIPEERRSKRNKTKPTVNTPTTNTSNDSFLVNGMDGTLGYNLKNTCINGIVDLSVTSRLSFLRHIPTNVAIEIISRLSCCKNIEYEDMNLAVDNLFSSVNNLSTLKKALIGIKALSVSNDNEENVKDIYNFILKMHLKKPFYFHDDRVKLYSEQDYIIKFWSYAFETFFGGDDHLFIHWGDTISQSCTNNNLKMRLDMRLMIMKHGKFVMDGSNCEYAAKTVSSKLYKDRLKLVLGGYSYIKQIIDSCPHLDEKDILDIKVPYLQIMGFSALISIIRVQDKGLLVTEDLMRFSFPFSKKQIRTGGITQMIKAFSLVKHLLNNLENIIEEGKVDDSNDPMQRIINEDTKARKSDAKLWVNEIISEIESEEEADDDDEEEEEEEDDEDGPGVFGL